MATNISFDGNSLQTANIFTSDIPHEGEPSITAPEYALAHAVGSKIPYKTYTSKQISIAGTIYGSSIADLDSRLDTFRSYFNNKDANLDIDYAGGTRRYIATANAVTIDRPGGLLFASFQVDFIATSGFGQDTTTTSALSASGRTNASYSDNYTFLGSAPFLQPIVTITLTALTGGSGATISFSNSNNGQTVNITRTWAVNDVLIIDSTTKKVTVNSVEVAYSGAIPEFALGAGTFAYSDNLTTRTFNYSVVYYKRYL